MKIILSAQCYSLYLYSLLMLFLPQIMSYSQFAIVLSAIAAIAMISYIFKNRKITWITLYTTIIGSLLVFLYYFGINSSTEQLQRTFFLVVLGQTLPAALLASIISTDQRDDNKIVQRIILGYVIALTFLVVMAIVFPNTYTRGGGLTTDFVLNYQNGSYLCAYISNFVIYAFVTGNVNTRFKKIIYIMALVIATFAMFAMGGRGGFVTYILINSFLLVFAMRKSGLSGAKILRNIAIGATSLFVLYFVISMASNFSLGGSIGFSRIQRLISYHSDSGRSSIYHKAFELITQRPLFGYGVGSVFGLLGTHAHNLIINCLLETGFVGTSLLVALLISTFVKCPKLLKYDENTWICIIIFLQGFTISMFSGYYLAQTLLFCGIVFIQGKSLRIRHERNQS